MIKILSEYPSVNQELLDYLADKYPDKLPHNTISVEELRFRQGQQSVIQELHRLIKKQFEE